MSASPYRTQAVRDLAWACFSPALLHTELLTDDEQNVTGCGLALTPERQHWLAQLDNKPQALQAYLSHNKSHRLGMYFERLWHFFLEQDKAIDLVAHNVAVRDKGNTLGEFDVLYWCHERQRHFHLELAVKFFLGHRRQTTTEPVSHWHEWLGSNSRDRLDLKIEQLLQRQIRLGEHPLAREQLAMLGIADLAQEITIKGYLFQPIINPLPAPLGVNTQLQFAQWLPQAELKRYLQQLEAEHFQLLPKARWLTPVHADESEELIGRSISAEKLQSLLAASGHAQLIAGTGPDGLELCRFFVTPNDWPTSLH